MKKWMAIFAHPDDEGAIAGTLAKYAHQVQLDKASFPAVQSSLLIFWTGHP